MRDACKVRQGGMAQGEKRHVSGPADTNLEFDELTDRGGIGTFGY